MTKHDTLLSPKRGRSAGGSGSPGHSLAFGSEPAQRAYPFGVTQLTFAHEPDASRYTLFQGSDLVSVLDYRDDGRSVALTRAYTVPTFRGHGYAGELVDRAVAELEAAGDRSVIPVCWYVADWFDAHPERAGILQHRRSA